MEPVVWDGGPDCEHEWGNGIGCPTKIGKQGSTETRKHPALVADMGKPVAGSFCAHCGAWLGCLGLEPTPEMYVDHLVQIFREVKRLLRDDGTLWLNIGDSYAGGNRGGNPDDSPFRKQATNKGSLVPATPIPPGSVLKPKDLVMIPFRLALALQEPYYTGRMKSEVDRAYLAGLIDGEGCLTILETKSPHGSGNSYPPILQVRMCNEAAVSRCATITKYGSASPKQSPPSQGGQNPSYHWRLNGSKAADIARELYPMLSVKRLQALVIWNHQQVRNSYHVKKGITIPKAALAKQLVCREIVQKLNHSKPVDIPSWMKEPPGMTEQGWWLRSSIIWHKPNVMPSSVKDRPTTDFEHVFLLAKSKKYYYDADAIKEPMADESAERYRYAFGGAKNEHMKATQNPTYVVGTRDIPKGRNKRTVWTVNTRPYKAAHFATFPPKLIEPMILAGSSDKACESCGAAWVATKEKTSEIQQRSAPWLYLRRWSKGNADGSPYTKQGRRREDYMQNVYEDAGLIPSCKCQENAGTGASIVFDPFAGSGTTLAEAKRHGRHYCGIEANPEYVALIDRRIEDAATQLTFE